MTTSSQEAQAEPGSARERERLLFDALRSTRAESVTVNALRDALTSAGLRLDDPRLEESSVAIDAHGETLSFDEFCDVVRPNIVLIEKAIRGDLAIPDFSGFRSEIARIHDGTRRFDQGAVADYIPQLGRVDPELYGSALCTVDGQRLAFGDAEVDFCIQSTCKPINYILALEENGSETVHRHIGCEPSGHGFNELSLNSDGRPHNPMINSGAIMSCSLIRPQLTSADRFDHVMKMWTDLSGTKPGFSNPTYLSERRTADRNFALGYFMRENGAFPEGTDLIQTLEFYFQCCSLEMTAEAMSVMAATLANGGISPLSGRRVLRPDTVQKCLSLMYSCGMYDFSGEWAFTVGLPAKSGVSGAVFVVVPNVLGLCIWSPRLDELGNSVRGIEFCRELVRTFNFHNYDNLIGGVHNKKDPRLPREQITSGHFVDLCWAASEGDLKGIKRLAVKGVELDQSDYDGRTALHVAASEGHEDVVAYFLEQGVEPSPSDRWGGTPLDDAVREGHPDTAALLQENGGVSGRGDELDTDNHEQGEAS